MEKKQTPEEKLLRLIENPTNAAKETSLLKKGFRLNFSWIRKVKLIKDKIKDKVLHPSFNLTSLNLKTVNRGLLVLSLMMAIYLIFDFIKGRPDLSQIYASNVLGHKQEAKASGKTQLMNLPDYLTLVEKRDIFHFVSIKKEDAVPTAKEAMVSLVSNFKLVGIIWGKSPQAMIEDKQENKTLLLNQGDSVGKIKIKEILRDRVILGYEGQEMELM